MGLAYCILGHKQPEQIARLLKALAHPGNLFLLHYDRRAPRAEHKAIARLARETPGACLLPSRAVLWGRYNMIGAQLDGMRRALEIGGGWTHFVTLTGQDFPLRPAAELAAEFEAARGTSYLSFFDPFTTPYWKNTGDRIDRYYLEWPALERLLQVRYVGRRVRALFGWIERMPFVPGVRRTLPGWFRYMGGSNHVIVAREAAEYTIRDPKARRIAQWLKHSAHPDETIFQTVLCNSPLEASLVNDDRRAIRWGAIGDPSPKTLTMADLPWLLEERAKGRLFARKFDPAVDAGVIDALEKELAR